jgi:hypothetical protein
MGNYDWCARTGADVVDHLPGGVGVLIDAGLPYPIAMSASFLDGPTGSRSESAGRGSW